MTDSAFHTGLLVSDYFRFPPPPYRGNHWLLNFILPPTELPMGSTHFGDKIYPAKEVVILAETKERAQRAADLIHAARLLLDGKRQSKHTLDRLSQQPRQPTGRSMLRQRDFTSNSQLAKS